MTVIVNRFDEGNPFELDKLNDNFQLLIAAINALAGDDVLSLGALVDTSPQYMPKTGGTFVGAVAMPSATVGGAAVVTTAIAATTATRGAVKMALAVANLAGSITNPPTQAEVTAIFNKVNALLAELRTAGLLAP
jgi:hypothetical protein